jgi:hypothetical protein
VGNPQLAPRPPPVWRRRASDPATGRTGVTGHPRAAAAAAASCCGSEARGAAAVERLATEPKPPQGNRGSASTSQGGGAGPLRGYVLQLDTQRAAWCRLGRSKGGGETRSIENPTLSPVKKKRKLQPRAPPTLRKHDGFKHAYNAHDDKCSGCTCGRVLGVYTYQQGGR